MSNSASRENSGQRSRWLWFVVAGCLLIIGLLLKPRNALPPARPGSADVSSQTSATGVNAPRDLTVASARRPPDRSNPEPARAAQGIVAGKLAQFARSR